MLGQENQGYFTYQSRFFPQGGLSSYQKRKLLSTLIGLVVCFAFLPAELLLSVGLAALSFYLDNWKGLTYTNAAKKSGIFFGMMSGASLIVLCVSGVAIVCCKGAALCLWPCRHRRKSIRERRSRPKRDIETELLISAADEEEDDEFSPYRSVNSDIGSSRRDIENKDLPLSKEQPIHSIQW